MMRTVKLADGKYEFDLDEHGLLVAARRHGVEWPAGLELRHTGCFLAALEAVAAIDDIRGAVRDEIRQMIAKRLDLHHRHSTAHAELLSLWRRIGEPL